MKNNVTQIIRNQRHKTTIFILHTSFYLINPNPSTTINFKTPQEL